MWRLKRLCRGYHSVNVHSWSGILFTHPPVPHPHPEKTEGLGPWPCLWEELQQLQQGLQPKYAEPSWGAVRGRGRRNHNLGKVPCDVNIGGKCPCPSHSLKFIPVVRNVGVKAIVVGLSGFGRCHPTR